MNRLRLVTFDVTNCLLRLRRPISDVYSEVAAGYGLKLQPKQIHEMDKAFKASYVELDTRYPCFGANNHVSEKDWWRQVMIHTFRRVGVVGQSQVLDRAFNDLFHRYATPDEWAVDQDALSLLPDLYNHGLKLGVIANWDGRLFELLNWLGMSDWLHFIVTSSHARAAKPSPLIFDRAAQEAEKFLNGEKNLREKWLHIGSDWATDIAGAKRASLAHAIRYTTIADDKNHRPAELASAPGVLELKRLGDVRQLITQIDSDDRLPRPSTMAA